MKKIASVFLLSLVLNTHAGTVTGFVAGSVLASSLSSTSNNTSNGKTGNLLIVVNNDERVVICRYLAADYCKAQYINKKTNAWTYYTTDEYSNAEGYSKILQRGVLFTDSDKYHVLKVSK